MTAALKVELTGRTAAKQALIVVGTGVSLASTGGNALASWKGLIADGVRRCVDRGFCEPTWADVQNVLLEGDLDNLLGVAEQVSRRLGWTPTEPCRGDWNKWLRDTVGALKAKDANLIEAIRDLGVPIATLNYDNLLTDVTNRRPITWKSAERWLPVLQGTDEAILHLHGHWDQPSSVVLGIRSYDAVMGTELAQHLQRVLASSYSLVFIGCSGTVQDPNFSALIDWMRQQLRGAEHSHYLLLRDGESLPVEESRLREARIVPLRYGASHADLVPFIRSLISPSRAGEQDQSLRPDETAEENRRQDDSRRQDERRRPDSSVDDGRRQENEKRLKKLKRQIDQVLANSKPARSELQVTAALQGWGGVEGGCEKESLFVDWLMDAQFPVVKDALLEAHENLKGRPSGDGSAAIEKISRLLLPWLYVAGKPIDTNWWGVGPLDDAVALPCGLTTFAEIVLAGLERREVLWDDISDWPSGRHRISCVPETGITPQFETSLREDLWRMTAPPPDIENKSKEIRDEAIKNQLAFLKTKGLKPYLIVRSPAKHDSDYDSFKTALRRLVSRYENLAFVELDASMSLADQNRFNEIRHLLVPGSL